MMSMVLPNALMAQTKYGDGTLTLTSELVSDWNAGSSQYVPRDSSDYTYNTSGKMTYRFQKQYNPLTSTWTPYLIQQRTYNGKGNMVYYLDSFLTTDRLNSRYKEIYEYNSSDLEILYLASTWNASTNNWVYSSRTTMTYTTAGKEATDLREKYDAQKGVWFNSARYTSTYDGSDRLLFTLKELWDTSTKVWNLNIKIFDYLNSKGYLDSFVYQTYNKAASNWEYTEKHAYTYDGSNRTLSHTSLLWKNGTWQPRERFSYTYTGDGQNKGYLYETWDTKTNAYVGNTATNYAYSAKNWLSSDSTSSWNAGKSSWEMTFKSLYAYLSSGYQSAHHTLKYNIPSMNWMDYSQKLYRYKALQGAGAKPTPQKDLKFILYPNPAKNTVTLRTAHESRDRYEISLFNLMGENLGVLEHNTFLKPDGIRMDLNNLSLAPGMYLIQVSGGDQIARLPLWIK